MVKVYSRREPPTCQPQNNPCGGKCQPRSNNCPSEQGEEASQALDKMTSLLSNEVSSSSSASEKSNDSTSNENKSGRSQSGPSGDTGEASSGGGPSESKNTKKRSPYQPDNPNYSLNDWFEKNIGLSPEEYVREWRNEVARRVENGENGNEVTLELLAIESKLTPTQAKQAAERAEQISQINSDFRNNPQKFLEENADNITFVGQSNPGVQGQNEFAGIAMDFVEKDKSLSSFIALDLDGETVLLPNYSSRAAQNENFHQVPPLAIINDAGGNSFEDALILEKDGAGGFTLQKNNTTYGTTPEPGFDPGKQRQHKADLREKEKSKQEENQPEETKAGQETKQQIGQETRKQGGETELQTPETAQQEEQETKPKEETKRQGEETKSQVDQENIRQPEETGRQGEQETKKQEEAKQQGEQESEQQTEGNEETANAQKEIEYTDEQLAKMDKYFDDNPDGGVAEEFFEAIYGVDEEGRLDYSNLSDEEFKRGMEEYDNRRNKAVEKENKRVARENRIEEHLKNDPELKDLDGFFHAYIGEGASPEEQMALGEEAIRRYGDERVKMAVDKLPGAREREEAEAAKFAAENGYINNAAEGESDPSKASKAALNNQTVKPDGLLSKIGNFLKKAFGFLGKALGALGNAVINYLASNSFTAPLLQAISDGIDGAKGKMKQLFGEKQESTEKPGDIEAKTAKTMLGFAAMNELAAKPDKTPEEEQLLREMIASPLTQSVAMSEKSPTVFIGGYGENNMLGGSANPFGVEEGTTARQTLVSPELETFASQNNLSIGKTETQIKPSFMAPTAGVEALSEVQKTLTSVIPPINSNKEAANQLVEQFNLGNENSPPVSATIVNGQEGVREILSNLAEASKNSGVINSEAAASAIGNIQTLISQQTNMSKTEFAQVVGREIQTMATGFGQSQEQSLQMAREMTTALVTNLPVASLSQGSIPYATTAIINTENQTTQLVNAVPESKNKSVDAGNIIAMAYPSLAQDLGNNLNGETVENSPFVITKNAENGQLDFRMKTGASSDDIRKQMTGANGQFNINALESYVRQNPEAAAPARALSQINKLINGIANEDSVAIREVFSEYDMSSMPSRFNTGKMDRLSQMEAHFGVQGSTAIKQKIAERLDGKKLKDFKDNLTELLENYGIEASVVNGQVAVLGLFKQFNMQPNIAFFAQAIFAQEAFKELFPVPQPPSPPQSKVANAQLAPNATSSARASSNALPKKPKGRSGVKNSKMKAQFASPATPRFSYATTYSNSKKKGGVQFV